MMSEMDSVEFSTWIARNRIDPIGEARADLRASIIASTIHNCNAKAKVQLNHYMPDFTAQYKQQIKAEETPEEKAKAIKAAMRGVNKRLTQPQQNKRGEAL